MLLKMVIEISAVAEAGTLTDSFEAFVGCAEQGLGIGKLQSLQQLREADAHGFLDQALALPR